MLKYRRFISKYGVLSILYALEYFEEKEIFEECVKIRDSIKSLSELINMELPTKITDEAINKIALDNNFNGFWKDNKEYLKERSKNYSLEIIDSYYKSISI